MLRAALAAALVALVLAPHGASGVGPHPGCAFDALPAGDPEDDEESEACYGKIRPGARMTFPAGCTLAWIVEDVEGDLYVATAGHCVGTGQSVSVWGVGPIGTTAYSSCCGAGYDFALVKIDPALHPLVDPTLCRWGGPSTAGAADFGEPVLVYGFGLVYGETQWTRARAGVAYASNAGAFQYVGMMQPGDSGSPVLAEDGTAVGVHVQSSLSLAGVRVDPSMKFATRLDAGLALAGAALGTTFSLVPSETPVTLVGA